MKRTFELSELEEREICQSSLERLLNNAEWIATRAVTSKNAELSERAGILLDDLSRVKFIASRLWDEKREEIFKRRIK